VFLIRIFLTRGFIVFPIENNNIHVNYSYHKKLLPIFHKIFKFISTGTFIFKSTSITNLNTRQTDLNHLLSAFNKTQNLTNTLHKTIITKRLPITIDGERLPDVICIGAKKCGTGALQRFLKFNSRIETGDSNMLGNEF